MDVPGDLPGDLAVALHEQMVVARTLDERLVALQREGRVAQHSSAAGEEGAVLGAVAALDDEDWVFPSAREFAAALWRGMPLAAYAQHVFGTALDASGGRNAPDPPFWRAARVASASPLLGTQIPHAVGLAWAARLRGERAVALVFFGEGTTSTGDFHAGLNLAGVTRAPVIAVCRNNGWAASLPATRQTASPDFASKAVAYGLRGVTVDGGDALAVLLAVREARARAAAGEGGTLIEARTGELGSGDPIERMRSHLQARGLWRAEQAEGLEREVAGDVEAALAAAASTAAPAVGSLVDHVYAEPPWHLREQRAALERREGGPR
jgi:2-oxoisovalerate dehydrogenase E1 component alpha subunit